MDIVLGARLLLLCIDESLHMLLLECPTMDRL